MTAAESAALRARILAALEAAAGASLTITELAAALSSPEVAVRAQCVVLQARRRVASQRINRRTRYRSASAAVADQRTGAEVVEETIRRAGADGMTVHEIVAACGLQPPVVRSALGVLSRRRLITIAGRTSTLTPRWIARAARDARDARRARRDPAGPGFEAGWGDRESECRRYEDCLEDWQSDAQARCPRECPHRSIITREEWLALACGSPTMSSTEPERSAI